MSGWTIEEFASVVDYCSETLLGAGKCPGLVDTLEERECSVRAAFIIIGEIKDLAIELTLSGGDLTGQELDQLMERCS